MIKYNLDYLLKVKVEDFRDIPGYEYKEYEWRFFDYKHGKPGFYYTGTFKSQYEVKDLSNINTNKEAIIGTRYMLKPRVLLCFVDRTVVEYFFPTLKAAERFRDNIVDKTGNKNRFI